MVTEKILVVDDEESICRSVGKILTRKGYSVADALTVNDAVRKMKETSFDLVITDLMMPGTGGMELMQIIRERYPELEVIMITGYASIESAVKATKLGAAGYLPKPFTPDELTALTEQALAGRKQRQPGLSTTTVRPPQPSRTTPKVAGTGSDDVLDVDMPFSAREVEQATSSEYVEALTHSDVPLAKKIADKAYCHTGKRQCRKVVKDGKECSGGCPIEKKEKARAAASVTRVVRRPADQIDVDLPFPVGEVERVAGVDYLACLDRSDIPRAGLYGRGRPTKHSVLVVDDEPVVCQSVRRILGQRQCSVDEAFDMEAALRKMKIGKYDLVILDLRMPKVSGMDVLEAIRKLHPDVPVIMVSGYATIENAIQATKLGAFQVLPKPFTPTELSRVAEEALVAA